MLFNSLEFIIFFPIVFALYWLARKNANLQNLVLIAGSCVFYAWVDCRFLFLIGITAILTYLTGRMLDGEQSAQKKKSFVAINVVVNLAILGFFKYFNFFADSFNRASHSVGFDLDIPTLSLVLPVGISFYTFKAISYSVDCYKGKMGGARSTCSVQLSPVLSTAFSRSY